MAQTVHDVIGLTRPSSDMSLLVGVKKVKIIKSETSQWEFAVRQVKPDVVIMCDWNGVRGSARDLNLQEENYLRQVRMLEESVKVGVKSVISLGSQAEVGKSEGLITESIQGIPLTNYGKIKRDLSEFFVNFPSGQTRVIWARIFSLYGKPQSDEWFISKIVSTLLEDKNFEMTEGAQIWNYLHINDCVSALLTLAEGKCSTGIVNIAHPDSVLLREVVNIITRNIQSKGKVHFGALPYRDSEPMKLLPDIQKLNGVGWKPVIDFEDGVREFIDWKRRTTSFGLNH
jgi:nucleoside-diphosphate-sugar epimerase